MAYQVRLKRPGETVISIEVGSDGFRVTDPVYIKNPSLTATVLNQLIATMKREGFEEVRIKKT